eukprot:TRINITY_DN12214_c0_g1_i1.p1 TRINITY_DN12214_c0_g1~~TRINITY_DN12214_c0_g1_i1.p1  ORF type:complete len:177 (+),score=28.60 TRINITY_DN12214_c0_g1_i1:91-621(+)
MRPSTKARRFPSSGRFGKWEPHSSLRLPSNVGSNRYNKTLCIPKRERPPAKRVDDEIRSGSCMSIEGISEQRIFGKYVSLQNSCFHIGNTAPYKNNSLLSNQKNEKNEKVVQTRFLKKSQYFSKYFSKLYQNNAKNVKRSDTVQGKGKWNRRVNKLIFHCNDLMSSQAVMRKYLVA